MNGLAGELAEAIGSGHVLTGPGMTAGYTTDWTGRYHGPAACVARPGSTADVVAVLRAAARHGACVVPQGGNTGLVGGSVPPPALSSGPAGRPCVVMSLRRLAHLGEVDRLSGHVTAGAGVTIGALRAHAAAAGLTYGVDLAARDSATVGGTIATNAGGIRTVRYGHTRAQIAGVEAVCADGTVLPLPGEVPGNTGYDLAGLLTGSEGTLAVITAARLRLWPAEPPAVVVLAGTGGIADAVALQAAIKARVGSLRAAEYFEAAGVDLVCGVAGLPLPLGRRYPAYLLAEITATPDHAERLAEAGLPGDAAVAVDGPGQARLWAYRERHTEAISSAGIPHKLDVAVPLGRIAEFRARLAEVCGQAAGPGAQLIVFGHLGVGNLHVNVLGPGPADESADEAILRLAAGHGGSVSAEHGIGRAKVRWLGLARSPEETAAMRAVRAAFDPGGVLNPGVLFS